MGKLRYTTFGFGPRLSAALVLGCLLLTLGCAQLVASAGATFKGRPGLIAFDDTPAYSCGRTSSVYVARPDMSHRRFLSYGSEPAFSPDGQRLIFSRDCEDHLGIWEVNVDGTALHLLIPPTPTRVTSPTFSPDGRRIAFLRKSPGGGTFDLWTAKSNGGGERQLTASPGLEWTPVWSPNGRYILFLREGVIYTIRPDGSHERRLGRGHQADISPDGHWIVFARPSGFERNDFKYRLALMRPSGKVVREFAGVDPLHGQIESAVFSPDGGSILYVREPLDGEFGDVWSVRVDGSRNHRVRRTPGPGEHSLDWQAR